MKQKLLIMTSCLLLLSGCEQIKNSLGMTHYQPDEYNVSSNPPLSLPNDYYLRPPSANSTGSEQHAKAPQDASVQSQSLLKYSKAKQAGSGKVDQTIRSQMMNNTQPETNIRQMVDQEAAIEHNTSSSLINHIMGWNKEFQKNINSYKNPQATQEAPSTGK